ncbi:hypothetical protein OL548_05015 [Lysinibacillus sp. MHQ-1]|nr:hypothetical protein OL548_05015 [Lysinibacillus sp. MHQ-1]
MPNNQTKALVQGSMMVALFYNINADFRICTIRFYSSFNIRSTTGCLV